MRLRPMPSPPALRRAALAALVTVVVGLASGCVYAPLDLGLSELGKAQEVTLVESRADAKILVLKIDGEITDSPGGGGLFGSGESTAAQVKDVLDLSMQDESIMALLVRIDSPGGGVTASDVIHRELREWKRKTKKPVVAVCMDTCASGGYYAAMAADKVIAHPTSIVGSIGVIAMLPNLSGLAQKVGVEVRAVKSGARKDMGSPFKPFDEGDMKVFQGLIDQMYARFVDVVAEGRKGKLTRAEVLPLADGRVYTANEALKAKLVDQVGYMDDAIAAAKALAGIEDARVVAIERKGFGAGRRTIYSKSGGDPIEATVLGAPRGPADVNVIKLDARPLLPDARPSLQYLWLPGGF